MARRKTKIRKIRGWVVVDYDWYWKQRLGVYIYRSPSSVRNRRCRCTLLIEEPVKRKVKHA